MQHGRRRLQRSKHMKEIEALGKRDYPATVYADVTQDSTQTHGPGPIFTWGRSVQQDLAAENGTGIRIAESTAILDTVLKEPVMKCCKHNSRCSVVLKINMIAKRLRIRNCGTANRAHLLESMLTFNPDQSRSRGRKSPLGNRVVVPIGPIKMEQL